VPAYETATTFSSAKPDQRLPCRFRAVKSTLAGVPADYRWHIAPWDTGPVDQDRATRSKHHLLRTRPAIGEGR
jgi:hypothetical protein